MHEQARDIFGVGDPRVDSGSSVPGPECGRLVPEPPIGDRDVPGNVVKIPPHYSTVEDGLVALEITHPRQLAPGVAVAFQVPKLSEDGVTMVWRTVDVDWPKVRRFAKAQSRGGGRVSSHLLTFRGLCRDVLGGRKHK